MTRILSRDRDKDPFNNEKAEKRFLQSKPICFIIIGKPGSGKTTLAKMLAKTWKCEIVNGESPLLQSMELETDIGKKAQAILLRGEALPEELASVIVQEKINSPEVLHHGYVLDGLPSLCEDWLSMKEQLELIKNWKLKPDFIINLKIPDRDLEIRRINQRVDPMTNKIYTKDIYDPSLPEVKEGNKAEEVDENGEVDQFAEDSDESFNDVDTDDENNLNEDEEESEFSADILERLLVRPEDLPENVAASIKRYKDLMLRMLEDYMTDHDQRKLIEVDANLPVKAVYKAVMAKLKTFGIPRALTTLRLQDEEMDEPSSDTDADEILRSLAAAQMVAPRFRWRRSRWSRLCPVELYNGNITNGSPQYAVSFLDKMYCLSSNEALKKFMHNPRPYITEPLPCPPCKICVLGPPCSGKTSVAKNLAQRYQAKYLDVDILISDKKKEAKMKLLQEIRSEAIEAAITKVNAKIQMEKEEEEERLAAEAEARLEAANDDDEGSEDEEEAKNDEVADGDTRNVDEEGKNEEKMETKASDVDIVKDEVIVDENHSEVIKLVHEAMKGTEQREVEISAEEYVDVIENAINERLKEVEDLMMKGQRLGGYVLDNFPYTREQFTLLIERSLLPDSVIHLKDSSEQGSLLAPRWIEKRRNQKHMPDMKEVDDDPQAIKIELTNNEMETIEESGEEPTTNIALSGNKKATANEMSEYQTARVTFENNWLQLLAVMKGSNNLEPTVIRCDKTIDDMTDDAIKTIEDAFIYHPWEHTGMDEDEEDEDDEEDEEMEEEEENNVFRRDVGRKQFGDTKNFCPVMLKERGVLWPGLMDFAAKYCERVYVFSSGECRRKFLSDPTQYLPVDEPLKPPPIRLFILGPKGSGKTRFGRYLAEKLDVFHIDFEERLQEKIMMKTKKRVGPDHEEDDEDDEKDLKAVIGADDVEGQDASKEKEELTLTEEEESIFANLTEGEHLQRDTVESVLNPWWNEEPFRSRGFVLEGFPRNDEESRVLSLSGLYPDAAILLGVEDVDVVKRLFPNKMERWKRKRDRRMAAKAKHRALIEKTREEARAKRKAEILLEMAERKAKLNARSNEDDDEDNEDNDDEDEMNEEEIEAILDGEFEEDNDLEEEDEEEEEEAADRIKSEIADRYDDDNSRLSVVQESLEEILVPRVAIDASRQPRIVQYCLNEALKPVVEYREAIFSSCYSISPALAQRMLFQGYKFYSRFGKWCPVKLLEGDVIQPYYPIGTSPFPVIYRQYIYFLSSEKAKSAFMSCPMKYLRQPSPKPMVPIQMAIIGPPKSGKTTLSKRFVAEYGIVRLSIGEVLRRVMLTQQQTDLVRQINDHLKSGCTVPDDLAIQALSVVLMDPQCQVRGFVLDGFPITKHQLDLMSERSIIPVKVLDLCVDDDEVFRRATQDRRSPNRAYPVHDSHTIISIRLACWKREAESVRKWYRNIQRNLVEIDGTRSKWLVWDTALKEAKRSVQNIQMYLVRMGEGCAASIANMCVTPKEFKERLGDFGEYCPVNLADFGQLVDCSRNSSLEFAAEFRGRYYKMESAKELEKFLDNPTAYVPPLAPRTLPSSDLLPKRRSALEMKDRFPCKIELQGYCPVTYLDGKKRYEFLVAGDPELVVEYRGFFYNFQSVKKLEAFMRAPYVYHGLKLPRKLPPPQISPLAVHQMPMLGFLEQTVADDIIKALTSVGCFKPKYPFLTATRSALLYMAYHLKAFNRKSSDYVRTKYKTKLKKFEEKCGLILYLGRNMSHRYRDPFQRPLDFDMKMKNFLDLKILKPTA